MTETRPPAASTLLESRAPWLLTTKVMPPESAEGYFHRPALIRQLDPDANRRISVLRAPGGFGKTTTLAEMSRRAKKRGVLVAWLTVDEDDAPGLFGAHLAYAFEHAGLDLATPNNEDAWTATPLTHQIGMLVRAIETHAGPCLLVLDELGRLPSESVDLLERLLRRGPRNLRFALSFRSNPGLDLANIVLEGSAVVVTTEQLRFSKAEVTRFFGGSNLPRRELSDIVERTAGWPVALRIDRSMRAAGSAESPERRKAITRNFLDVRLLRRLSDRDRALVLDLAVFDWVDMDLADEVFESTDTRFRVDALVALDGLLTPVDGNRDVRRLHPLLREHCVRVLANQDPVRKRQLHRRIAEALARRGHMIPAWRHAGETGDGQFLGEMMERVGVFRMWLREGMTCLAAADRFLTPVLMEEFPRLALIRCVARRLRLEFEEARALFQTTEPKLDEIARRGGSSLGVLIDRLFTGVVLVGAHARSASENLKVTAEAGVADHEQVEQAAMVQCGLRLSNCVSSYDGASFELCRQHGLEVLSYVTRGGFRHGEVFVSVYLGLAAMAQGRVEEAASRYAAARGVTRAFFASDAALATIIDALVMELDIERDRRKTIDQRTVSGLTTLRGAWIEVHEAAISVAAELTLERHGPVVGIEFLTDEIAKVRAMGLAKIVRYASALLSLFLVEAGRSGQAQQAWSDERLPTDASALLDLDGQSWREMETLSCARIRLLSELGKRDAARDLANSLRRIASERGLTRTLMRTLALSMTIDADSDRAREPLVEFLRLTRSTDYLRPLARHRDVSRGLLTRLLAEDQDPEIREAAESALAHLDGPPPPSGAVFSPREEAVLAELRKGRRNREIADRLRISEDGVRHHLKNIYRKTGTTDRSEAVRRATSMGLRP